MQEFASWRESKKGRRDACSGLALCRTHVCNTWPGLGFGISADHPTAQRKSQRPRGCERQCHAFHSPLGWHSDSSLYRLEEREWGGAKTLRRAVGARTAALPGRDARKAVNTAIDPAAALHPEHCTLLDLGGLRSNKKWHRAQQAVSGAGALPLGRR